MSLDNDLVNKLLPQEIMALTIWGEARGEPIEGQIAVGNVIFNRWIENKDKYKTVKEVCLQPKQFSCWNERDSNRSKLLILINEIINHKHHDRILDQCLFITGGILRGQLLDNTKVAKFYMTKKLFNSSDRPEWSYSIIGISSQIGNHVFFNI